MEIIRNLSSLHAIDGMFEIYEHEDMRGKSTRQIRTSIKGNNSLFSFRIRMAERMSAEVRV